RGIHRTKGVRWKTVPRHDEAYGAQTARFADFARNDGQRERQGRKTREKDKRERQERGGPRRPVAWVATDETAKAAASRRTPKREEDGRKELWRGGSCGPAPRPGRGKRQGGPYNGKPKSTVPSSLRAGRSDCATKRVSR